MFVCVFVYVHLSMRFVGRVQVMHTREVYTYDLCC